MKKEHEKKPHVYIAPENFEKEYHEEIHLSFLGFTIFDIGHILMAVILLVFSCIVRQPSYGLEIAKCITELIFAALLMTFVDALSKDTTKDITAFRKNYSYAFLCVNASLLVPLSMSIVVVFESLNDSAHILTLIAAATSLASLIVFLVTIFVPQKNFVWRALMVIGVILLGAYVPLMIASTIIEEEDIFLKIMMVIHYTLPLFPAVIAFTRLIRHNTESVLF